MVRQLPAVNAFGNHVPIQVHPAPNADYWGATQSNCHIFTVDSEEAVVWQAHADATLVAVETTADIRMLVNGADTVAAAGLPIYAGREKSFGIPAGASVAFIAVGDEAIVSIVEA